MVSRHVLFLFLDGVGLGENDPSRNPFCVARMPLLASLLGNEWYLSRGRPITGARASLVPTDACMGVSGRPQSATGQAALLTGRNVPGELGRHYGPKPTPRIAAILKNGNLFANVLAAGGTAAFLNPYPPRFFDGVSSGRRLLSAIPLAAKSAGLRLRTHEDLMAGRALSPDFTGVGWRERLNYSETPILSLSDAGSQLGRLAQDYAFSFFEHWPTDIIGHRQEFHGAVAMLEKIDGVLSGLLDAWNWTAGLILITSDHGNIEDLGVRTHTRNPVPTVLIGPEHAQLAKRVRHLADVAPMVERFLWGP